MHKHQLGLEQSMNSDESENYHVEGIFNKCHKIILSRGGSYVKSPKWINNEKKTIDPKNNDDDMRFKYTAAVKLKLENTGKHLERIICIRPSTYQ